MVRLERRVERERGLTLLVRLAAGEFKSVDGRMEKRAFSRSSEADAGLLELIAAAQSGDSKGARAFVAAVSASGAILAI